MATRYNYTGGIVTDGLVLHLDAAKRDSYPGSGTTWYDLSGNGAHSITQTTPTHTFDGKQSYFSFDGTDDQFESVDISQEYRDLFLLFRPTTSPSSLEMVFSKYNNADKSFRLHTGKVRTTIEDGGSGIDTNDWQYGTTSDVFINGTLDAVASGDFTVKDNWNVVRTYRSNDSFGTSFRYEVSSGFTPGGIGRPYVGDIAVILCYNRKLSNTEVTQNYNALKGRYGL